MRITDKQLRAAVDRVNRALGHPVDDSDGPVGWSNRPGAMQLAQAYGGHAVHRVPADGRGVVDLTGFESAACCRAFLRGMLAGLEAADHV